ncbi:hypothetical protein [Cohnella sp. GCM10012308]|uniref:hypothetical protein n=1 Tax=Cohnella sp. GCM10012308 TaxID=3317329 RepID=UPI0036078AFA
MLVILFKKYRNLRSLWTGAAVLGLLLLLGAIGYEWLGFAEPRTSAAVEQGSPTEKTMTRPYVDWKQQEIPFGVSSIDRAPWRSYMDTWDGSRFLDTLGVVLNGVSPEEADATAQLLSNAGFRSARIEIGWGNVSFDNENVLNEPQGSRFVSIISALKKHGIRPIVLLNANSGNPVPSKTLKLHLKKNASKGEKAIYVDNVTGIVPQYTGLSGQAYQTMYPVITAVDAKTGKLTLSAPLSKDLKAGTLNLTRLKYRPLSGTKFADGKDNPAAQQTLNGWNVYLNAVTNTLMGALGTKNNSADKGFDLEVWNEMTFGSQFLDIGNYYDPKLQFSQYPVYTLGSRKATGGEVLLPMTISFAKQKKLAGVRVISGFSNQRPWENGAEIFAGEAGFSRHYYTGFNGAQSLFGHNAQTDNKNYISATGKTNPGSKDYLPAHTFAMPEYWFYAYHTEYIVRDLQPFPGPFSLHGRYSNAGDGRQAEVWMTETNWWRNPLSDKIALQAGVNKSDNRLRLLMQQIGAKSTLRLFTFYSHKGVETVELYSAKGGDTNYGLINDAFFEELNKNGFKLTEKARSLAGPQINALARVSKIMSSGQRIENPRPVGVSGVVEVNPQIALSGNGTADHPDTNNMDDLAILPYQLNANQYAVGYYVVTRDLTKEWQKDKSVLDPARYAMPNQKFKITLNNVNGQGATVYAYDPITDQRLPALVLESTNLSITVEVSSTDYPRFLMIDENKLNPSPLISDVRLEKKDLGANLIFSSNRTGTAKIQWGPYPVRSGGKFTLSRYENVAAQTPSSTVSVPMITNAKAQLGKGVWVFKGTIQPDYSEEYTFLIDMNPCKFSLMIDSKYVINGCGTTSNKSGSIRLAAGQSYDFVFTIENNQNTPFNYTLYWASASQVKEPVTAVDGDDNVAEVIVNEGAPANIFLPGFQVGDGVRIELQDGTESVQTRFPAWNYDVRGVLWPQGG